MENKEILFKKFNKMCWFCIIFGLIILTISIYINPINTIIIIFTFFGIFFIILPFFIVIIIENITELEKNNSN